MNRARVGPVLLAWTRAPDTKIAGTALLRDLIAALAPGSACSVTRHCAHCGSDEHGAPMVQGAPIAVGLSYADDIVVAAATLYNDARAIGVDIEREPGALTDLAPLFTPHPPPDRAGWTRIEAVLKADGRGLRVAPGAVSFTSVASSALPSASRARVPGNEHEIEVATVELIDGYAVSVALITASG